MIKAFYQTSLPPQKLINILTTKNFLIDFSIGKCSIRCHCKDFSLLDSTKANEKAWEDIFTYFNVIFSSFTTAEENRENEELCQLRRDGAEREIPPKLWTEEFLVQQTSSSLFGEFSLMRCGCLWVIISHSEKRKEKDSLSMKRNLVNRFQRGNIYSFPTASLTSSCVARIVFWCSTMTTRLGRRLVERRDVTVNDVVKVLMES